MNIIRKEKLIISIIIEYLYLEEKEKKEINIQYFRNYIYNLMDLDIKTLNQISKNIWEQIEG